MRATLESGWWRGVAPGSLRRYEAPLEQRLGDLNRVQGRALAQVVVHAPECKPGAVRRIRPDPADEDIVAPSRILRRRKVVQRDVRCRAESLARLLGRERFDGLDPDRLRVTEEDRHAHALR